VVEPEETGDEEEFPSFGPSPAATSVRRRTGAQRQAEKKVPLRLILIIALIFLGFCGLSILALAALSSWRSPDKGSKTPEREPIMVGTNGLAQALQKARPGDRFVLQSDLTEEDVTVRTPNITIEGEEGKQVVWKSSKQTGKGNHSKLLMVQGVANVTVKNITFDGGGNTDSLVILYALCPGTRLENLRFRGAAKYGVLLGNCQGAEDNKVVLRDLHFDTPAGKTAIRFHVFPGTKAFTVNRFIRITNCLFSGPGDKVTTENSDFYDPDSVELPSGVNQVPVKK